MSQDKTLSLTEKMKAAALAGAAKAAEETKAKDAGKAEEPKVEEPKAPRVKSSEHEYQGNHVKRLVLANGTIVLPDAEGIFIPKSQEEYDMLEHMAARPDCSLEKL